MPLSAPAPFGWRGFPVTHSAGTSCGHGAGAEGTQPGGSVFWGHLLREGGLGVPPPGRNRSVLCQEDCRPYLGNLLFLQAAGLGPGDQRAAGLLPGLCPLTHHVRKSNQVGLGTQLTHSATRHCCCCSVALLCPTLCDPMDCSTPGFPVLCQLPELAQTQVHWVVLQVFLDLLLLHSNPL